MSPRRAPARAGFTLAEILVAISVFMVLGSMLVLAMTSAVDTWRQTEDRRLVYAEASMILKQVQGDLQNLVSPRPGESGESRVRLLCDLDKNHRYRLRFVRTLPGENQEEALRWSGFGPPDVYNDVMDGSIKADKRFQPLEGLMEVAYVMDPDPKSNVLYRMVRSPVGGETSLFVDKNIESAEAIRKRGTPVSSGVLFLGYHFWTQYTTTWKLETALSDNLGSECGPEIFWDSSRGVLPHPKSPDGKKAASTFWMAAGAASRDDPSDDVFPRQIRVFVSIAAGGSSPYAVLEQDLTKRDKDVRVDRADGFPTGDDPELFRYLRVGTEWIHFKDRTAFAFDVSAGGRGARGTRPQDHPEGTEVWGGRTFTETVEVPSYRDFWSGKNMSRVLERHRPENPPWVDRMQRERKNTSGNR